MPVPRKGSRKVAPAACRADREAAGRGCRKGVPRALHGQWKAAGDGRDPIAILQASNKGRLENLIPIRYGRMVKSPFTFMRGSAAVMAHDLAGTPVTGLDAQLCGDCHLLNFGLFATPERHLVFDLNDFDETLPGPWEWDVKRLAASVVVAGRENGFSEAQCRGAVMTCVGSYRETVRACARMSPLEVWYMQLDWQDVIDRECDPEARKVEERVAEAARKRVIEHLSPKIVKASSGGMRFVDTPPLLYHAPDLKIEQRIAAAMARYRLSLPGDRRVLFDRYRVKDFALKVVGIGSVGTRCAIVLLLSHDDDVLVLQLKEARKSVLEPYAKRCSYANQGERVVQGQHLMQSSSDIFLGWVRAEDGRDYYVRQLRDMKFSAPIEQASPRQLNEYAKLCGWTLARAHSKSGDAAAIGGYLGKGDRFDQALAKFAVAYADQTERDHAALVKAIRAGRVEMIAEQ